MQRVLVFKLGSSLTFKNCRHASLERTRATVIKCTYRSNSQSIFDFVDRAPKAVAKSYCFASGAAAFPKNESITLRGSSSKARVDLLESEKNLLSVTCGEDAYFVRSDGLGIADGVGAWAYSDDNRANSAWFSTKLMHYMSETLEKMSDLSEVDYHINADPVAVLEHSYQLLIAEAKERRVTGSTTAALAILRDDELKVCNLGDCGVLIIRDGQMVFRTEEQQHSFNFPFQLGTNAVDKPEHADAFSFKVREGDVLVMGTDGLFDNLFDEDIVALVNGHSAHPGSLDRHGSASGASSAARSTVESLDPKAISYELAKRAREVAEDVRYVSTPFLNKAIQEGLYYNGGKLDDITVIVSHVRVSEDSPDRR